MSHDMRFPTMWYVGPAKPQTHTHSLIKAFASRLNILRMLRNWLILSLTGGCTGSPWSTLVKTPHCWKSHVTAHAVWQVRPQTQYTGSKVRRTHALNYWFDVQCAFEWKLKMTLMNGSSILCLCFVKRPTTYIFCKCLLHLKALYEPLYFCKGWFESSSWRRIPFSYFLVAT